MWTYGRPLHGSSYPAHWEDQGLYGHQGMGFSKSACRHHINQISVQSSASYFLGDANNDTLQRIYGISFPDKKQLSEYKAFLAEAAKRDHRRIGKVLDHLYVKKQPS